MRASYVRISHILALHINEFFKITSRSHSAKIKRKHGFRVRNTTIELEVMHKRKKCSLLFCALSLQWWKNAKRLIRDTRKSWARGSVVARWTKKKTTNQHQLVIHVTWKTKSLELKNMYAWINSATLHTSSLLCCHLHIFKWKPCKKE